MLQRLADQLRSEAGKLSDSDGWSPTGFAVFDGDIQRHARAIPGVRQPSKGRKQGTSQGHGKTPGKRTRKPTHRDRTVVSAISFGSSAKPQLDANGHAVAVRGNLRIHDSEAPGPSEELALRGYIESGSDATCDQPIPYQGVAIASATLDGVPQQRGGRDIPVAPTTTEFDLRLGTPVTDPGLVKVEVVRREKPKPQETT